MGVAGQASTDLSTEAVEVALRQAPLEKGAGVDARRRVSLEVNLVTCSSLGTLEKVVEPHLVESGRRGVGRQMAADAVGPVVCPGHHHRRVPAHVVADPSLDRLVTREGRFGFRRDRVHVVGKERPGHLQPQRPGARPGGFEHPRCFAPTMSVNQVVDRVRPLRQLVRVDLDRPSGWDP